MYKILLGIPAMFPSTDIEYCNEDGLIVDLEVTDAMEEDGFDIWNDFEVTQDDEGFHLSFETCIGFETKEGARDWIIHCCNEFTNYMLSHNYEINRELSLYTVFTYGANVNTAFHTLEDAYAFMKLMIFGFHGHGMTFDIPKEAKNEELQEL